MKTPALYVACQQWNRPMVEALKGHATGLILGDLFCQKRMFENEWFDVIDFARLARELGLEVIFQTPVYNTTRNLEPTISLVRKMAANSLIDAVLVHDIGVVESLAELESIALWWDRFSFNRDFVPNAHLIDFLTAHRVSRVEVTRPGHIREVAEQGCGVLLYGYGPQIASFGRICYTEYFLNEPCERKILCSCSRPFIASSDKVPLQYVADGYTLLDKDEPMHPLPQLDASLRTKVDGVTAYIRNQGEIASLDKMVTDLSNSALSAEASLQAGD